MALPQPCRVNQHIYEVRSRKDHRGFDLISDVLPFGRLWYDTPDNAIGYAMHSSRSHDAVIHAYDAAGNVIETHEHKGDFTITGRDAAPTPSGFAEIVSDYFPSLHAQWIHGCFSSQSFWKAGSLRKGSQS